MKAGWEIAPLGDVCKVTNGGTPKSAVASYWGGNVNWLTPKDMGKMNGRHIAETPRKITDEGLGSCSARLVPANSVIMSTRAPIGHLAINDVPMAFNQGCRGMVPGSRLGAIYLFHFLSANREALNDLGTGATFKELSSAPLKAFPIPLPPLEEQQRIVAVLDEAFEGLALARENAEVNLKNARELFEAFLRASLSEMIQKYGEVALDEHCDFRNGFAFKSSKFKPAGMPIVRISNIHEDGMKLERLVHTDPVDYSEDLSRYEVQPGELLIAMSGATTGKLGFNNTSQVYLQNQRVGRFCETSTLRLQFLSFYLTTKIEENLAISAGAAQPNLSTKQIREIKLPVPPIAVQDDFIAKLTAQKAQATSLHTHYREKLQDLDDLRQSLLQKAFAGELT